MAEKQDPDEYLLRHADPKVKKLHRQARRERREEARKKWKNNEHYHPH